MNKDTMTCERCLKNISLKELKKHQKTKKCKEAYKSNLTEALKNSKIKLNLLLEGKHCKNMRQKIQFYINRIDDLEANMMDSMYESIIMVFDVLKIEEIPDYIKDVLDSDIEKRVDNEIENYLKQNSQNFKLIEALEFMKKISGKYELYNFIKSAQYIENIEDEINGYMKEEESSEEDVNTVFDFP
jgi:hypothetical protein